MLSAVINWHSQVGPRLDLQRNCTNILEFMKEIYRPEAHIEHSEFLEKKSLWFEYFGGDDVFTHMGKELHAASVRHLSDQQQETFVRRLTNGFVHKRFLSKSPTNSFRIEAIHELFPEARFVAIYRRGESVISSWGRRAYGFHRSAEWGEAKYESLSYVNGIRIFRRKWLETINHVESLRSRIPIYTLAYERLVDAPLPELTSLFSFLELPHEDYLAQVRFEDTKDKWKQTIPLRYRPWVRALVAGGNRRISEATSHA